MTTQWFGERVERREDQRLLIGAGRSLDDVGHDALAPAFVRSPHAHARIAGIDVADALEVEGLVAAGTVPWAHAPSSTAATTASSGFMLVFPVNCGRTLVDHWLRCDETSV